MFRGLADAIGYRGHAYVEREYRWDAVLERYERLLRADRPRPRATA